MSKLLGTVTANLEETLKKNKLNLCATKILVIFLCMQVKREWKKTGFFLKNLKV